MVKWGHSVKAIDTVTSALQCTVSVTCVIIVIVNGHHWVCNTLDKTFQRIEETQLNKTKINTHNILIQCGFQLLKTTVTSALPAESWMTTCPQQWCPWKVHHLTMGRAPWIPCCYLPALWGLCGPCFLPTRILSLPTATSHQALGMPHQCHRFLPWPLP